ncbi:MAG: diguanylate cyclase [Candidatus Electronema sp. VV]
MENRISAPLDTLAGKTAVKLRTLNGISCAVLLFWSGTLITLLYWAVVKEEGHALHYARLEARANFNKDMALRNWVSKRGGIYVPVSADTPPSPYLAHMSERDVKTASGKQLTLMNATYLLRQTMNEFSELYGIRGRITSLNPLNADNAPDVWETAVLEQFEQGVQEVSEVAQIGGAPYLRYMQAVYAEESCLSCHFQQHTWKKGNVRGGIGVSVPLVPYLAIKRHTARLLLFSYSLLWLLGAVGIFFVNRFARRQMLRQENTEAELERLNEVLSRQARHDELTQIFNRRAFNQRLCEEWQCWQRNQQHVFSVLLADIDFFKCYNDTYGHLMGDSCLRAVAEALKKTTTRPGDFTARYGGEEFVLLLPGTDLSQALAIAERVRQAVEQLAIPHSSSSCAEVVTLSIGAASSVQAAAKFSCHDLIDLADKALYEAKRKGRNRTENLLITEPVLTICRSNDLE